MKKGFGAQLIVFLLMNETFNCTAYIIGI